MHNLEQSRQRLTQMITINLTEWRTIQVKNVCSQLHWPSRNGKMKFDLFLVSDKHKYVYCLTGKVASTSWKRALNGLDFEREIKDSIRGKICSRLVSKCFRFGSKFKPAEVLKRLKKYYTFMFVREPLERLVSAYRVFCVTQNDNWVTRAVHRHCHSSNKGNNKMQ